MKTAAPAEPKVRVNYEIRARQIRVISEDGEQLGIMAPQDAMREAEARGLDLVEVAPLAQPPVCRIMDYGKYRYEQKRRTREARKNQHTVTVKEVKYRPKIDKHDLEFKNGHVREFLEAGNKVKVTIMFRGREMAHPEFGRDILAKVVEATNDITTGEQNTAYIPIEGRNMSLVLSPSKTVMKNVAAKVAAAKAATPEGQRHAAELKEQEEKAAQAEAAMAEADARADAQADAEDQSEMPSELQLDSSAISPSGTQAEVEAEAEAGVEVEPEVEAEAEPATEPEKEEQ